MAIRPTDIHLNRKARILKVTFEDGATFDLPCEYLRVFSPSAEVRGHGPGQEVLQTGKGDVNIQAIEPVGNYAVRLVFDDGHSSGLYFWNFLYELGVNQERNWRDYLDRLAKAGYQRKASHQNPSLF